MADKFELRMMSRDANGDGYWAWLALPDEPADRERVFRVDEDIVRPFIRGVLHYGVQQNEMAVIDD